VVLPPAGQAGQGHAPSPLVHQGGVSCNHITKLQIHTRLMQLNNWKR
jgi:hypothetical protein